MKSTQFATLLFSALLALLAGCATAEPEIESPADITVSELETKMRTAMDPDGRYAKAKTFIQRQIVSTERFLDDPEEQVVEVKFERPANFRLTTLDDNVPVSGLIVSGNNGWMVDYSGERIVELTPEQLDQLKILSGISNPDNSLPALSGISASASAGSASRSFTRSPGRAEIPTIRLQSTSTRKISSSAGSKRYSRSVRNRSATTRPSGATLSMKG